MHSTNRPHFSIGNIPFTPTGKLGVNWPASVGAPNARHWRVARLLLGILLNLIVTFASTSLVHAFHRTQVTATITLVRNKLVKCFDPLVVGCSRPDYFAVITFESRAGQASQSCSFRSEHIRDRDTINPNWTCSATIANPTVVVEIWDFDGDH